jgi:hypothetical protein
LGALDEHLKFRVAFLLSACYSRETRNSAEIKMINIKVYKVKPRYIAKTVALIIGDSDPHGYVYEYSYGGSVLDLSVVNARTLEVLDKRLEREQNEIIFQEVITGEVKAMTHHASIGITSLGEKFDIVFPKEVN